MWRDRYMHYCLWTLCLRMFEERLLWWHCMQSSVSCSHCCSHFRLSGNADVITPDLLHGVLKVCSMVFFFFLHPAFVFLYSLAVSLAAFSPSLCLAHMQGQAVWVSVWMSHLLHTSLLPDHIWAAAEMYVPALVYWIEKTAMQRDGFLLYSLFRVRTSNSKCVFFPSQGHMFLQGHSLALSERCFGSDSDWCKEKLKGCPSS